ncbi:type IV secretory system conjugative DNA transfer family protein [Nostocales cyanobacterium LEGE 11386]|nr:type IV secretory system conjugative DNA transfer family protein [Nostocales cyanobacterium LEGE 11386]
MLDFAITQQRPILIYDSNYPSIAKIALHARDRGYDIHILAPGFPESATFNLLDLVKDSTDSVAAHDLATIIYQLSQSNVDSFFTYSSIQLIQAVLMLAKEFTLADLLTASAILECDRLTERLMAAPLNPWLKLAFGQLLSTVGTKTNTEIITTAFAILGNFIATQSASNCFLGAASFPLKIKDKQLVILGFNAESQAILASLMSSIMPTIITYDAVKPLVFTTDELFFAKEIKHLTIPIIKNSPHFNEFNHESWNNFTSDIVQPKTDYSIIQKQSNIRKLEIEQSLPIPQLIG